MLEESIQQTVQNHRVGDVGHVEFVKAQELVTLGHSLAQHIQRIHRALQFAQLTVHFAHELVKVQTRLALDGYRAEKAIHQETFPATHTAVHVHTPRDLGAEDHFFERVGALGLVV